MNGVSVIICCYNSASRISLALEYLANQQTNPGLQWEVIIVNNNSTDNTIETAKHIWQSLHTKKELCIIDEHKTGLSYARTAGVQAALYNIIIFCDDDNLLSEDYVQHAYNLVHKTAGSGYGIWGGKINALFDKETTIPSWFEKEKANYVIGEQSDKTGDISGRGYIWGAGMIILKDLYLKIINENLPFLLADRTGAALSAGGDSEISLRTLIAGYKLYYDDALVLQHYVQREKLTTAYNEKLINGFIAANGVLNKYKIFIHYISGATYFLRLAYAGLYAAKLFLQRLGIKKLTAHDKMVLHAFFSNHFSRDEDFILMYRLLKIKNQTKLQYSN